MVRDEIISEVWKLTKPPDKDARQYLEALKRVFKTSERNRFRTPFFVEKSDGGKRKITQARKPLGFVQWILSLWIQRSFPLTADFCYQPPWIKGAVQAHQGADGAIIFDLKSAYDQVTTDRIVRKFALCLKYVSREVLEAIASLLTYQGLIPQGCSSTPYVFNIVVSTIDRGLELLKMGTNNLGIFAVTRYVDNICVSVLARDGNEDKDKWQMQLAWVEKQVRAIIEGNGFDLSWVRVFEQMPIEYLGTRIYSDRLQLDEEKYGEFCDIVMVVLENEYPIAYEHKILGIYSWARYVCGDNIPLDLLELLGRYFSKIHKVPPSLSMLWSRRMMDKLPGMD